MSSGPGRAAARIVARASRGAVRAPRSHLVLEAPVPARPAEPSPLPGPVQPSPAHSEPQRPSSVPPDEPGRGQETLVDAAAPAAPPPEAPVASVSTVVRDEGASSGEAAEPELEEAPVRPAPRDASKRRLEAHVVPARRSDPAGGHRAPPVEGARARAAIPVPAAETPGEPFQAQPPLPVATAPRLEVPPRSVVPPAPAPAAPAPRAAPPTAAGTAAAPAPNVVIDQILVVTPPEAPRDSDPFASLGPRRVGASRHGRRSG